MSAPPSRVERAPRPSWRQLRIAIEALRDKGPQAADPENLAARDPRFIDRVRPLMDLLYDDYFRCETELHEEAPQGPLLVVANHNGMSGTPDMFCHMTAFWRRYGSARAAYGLMHDFPFRVPYAGPWLNACGALGANPVNANAALEAGAAVLVFPGGDIDSCKPYRRRYRIELAGRRGFLRVAIRAGVPIMPIVSVGGHSSLFLLSDGRAIAQLLDLPRRIRTNVFPIGFAMPWGLIFGNAWPHLPPPVKIHTRFLRPIRLPFPPSAADDPVALDSAYRQVESAMQAELDELRALGRHGLFPRRASG